MVALLLSWSGAVLAGLIASIYTALRGKLNESAPASLWMAGVATIPGAGLMIRYLVATAQQSAQRKSFTTMLDVALMVGAASALLVGPLAFAESIRRLRPFRGGIHVEVIRGLFLLAWTIAGAVVVLSIVYV